MDELSWCSAVPIGDPTAVQVVRAELDLHLVARQDADVVLAHLPGDGCQDGMTGLELHPEHRARERLDDLALNLDLLFLGRHFLSTLCCLEKGLFAHSKAVARRTIIVAKRLRRSSESGACRP